MDVITFGETMVLFSPVKKGPLRYVPYFMKQMGGAESNVAIGLQRLGHQAGWFGKLGDDEFGRYIHSFIRGEGVDTSRVMVDPAVPTGIYFKEWRSEQDTRVYYYRWMSAASRLTPDDLDADYIKSAKFLHITGITPALSTACREAVYRAIEIAREGGLTVTFDPNIRMKLWDAAEAKAVLRDIASKSDIVLPGEEEGKLLSGHDDPEKMSEWLIDAGAKAVVVKLGKAGAHYMAGNEKGYVPGYPVERVVDPVGAGDGFACGLLSGRLRGMGWKESIRLGHAIGALVVSHEGDVEGLPTFEEVHRWMAQTHQDVER